MATHPRRITARTSAPDQPDRLPRRVYVFERATGADLTALNRRVAACYAWADARQIAVLDEIIDWSGFPGRHERPQLAEAVAACERDHAGLLVHSPDAVRAHPGMTIQLKSRLARLIVVTACGPTP